MAHKRCYVTTHSTKVPKRFDHTIVSLSSSILVHRLAEHLILSYSLKVMVKRISRKFWSFKYLSPICYKNELISKIPLSRLSSPPTIFFPIIVPKELEARIDLFLDDRRLTYRGKKKSPRLPLPVNINFNLETTIFTIKEGEIWWVVLLSITKIQQVSSH